MRDRGAGREAPDGVLVMGVGNEVRSDDGVGPAVARALRGRAGATCRVLEHTGEPAGLLEAWQGAHTVILVDATAGGGAPGTVRRFEVGAEDIPREAFPCSTHGFGMAEAIALARALGRLPRRLIIYGVEGRSFEPGGALSPPVRRAVPRVVRRLLEELGAGGTLGGEGRGRACTRHRWSAG